MQGNKVTVGAPFYNRVRCAHRTLSRGVSDRRGAALARGGSSSFKAVKRNFVLPVVALWATIIVCLAVGVRPWKDGALDQGSFYAVVAFAVAAAVLTAIIAEFLRGAGVISRQTRRNLFAATWLLTRRNTRRYGGYIIHIGVVVVVIGLAGSAFNRSIESEMGLHSKMSVGPYTLECMGFTQDSNLNYNSDYAVLDVYKGGKKVFQMTPERHCASGKRPAADHGRDSFGSRVGSLRGV